jgi:uncharacterized protein (TIGR02118 family)
MAIMKIVYLAKRSEGMSHEECMNYWKNDHAAIVRELPGLRKYTLGEPLQPEETEWDGVAELYFDSPQAMQEAFESEAGQEMLEDGPNFTMEEPQINIPCEETVLHED